MNTERSALVMCLLAAACSGADAPQLVISPLSPTTEDALVVTADPEPAENAELAWFVDDKHRGDGWHVSASKTKRGERWVAILSKPGGRLLARNAVVIRNSPPSVTVTWAEPNPTTHDDLVAEVATVDVDGDAVDLTYLWSREGQPQPGISGASVPSAQTVSRDVWTVTVSPSDQEDVGEPVTATIAIDNAAPIVETVAITPAQPNESSTLIATTEVTDVDPVELSFTWTVDAVTVQQGPLETLTGDSFDRGDLVAVEAIATDGSLSSLPVLSEAVLIGNALPEVAAANIDPSPPVEGSLWCAGSGWSDADGDPEAYQTEWIVNGVSASSNPTIDGSLFDRSDTVSCVLTPDDGLGLGQAVASNEETVANTPPELAAVTISPNPAYIGDLLTVAPVGAEDADGDLVTYTYAWEVNGADAGSMPSLDTSELGVHDVVQGVLTPGDGLDEGTPTPSPNVTFIDRPPTGSVATIRPQMPIAGRAIICEIDVKASDPDGDDVTYTFDWTVDGAPYIGGFTYNDGDTIPAGVTAFGEVWSCTATSHSNLLSGPSAVDDVTFPGALGGNILIVLADDVGTDNVVAYGEHPSPNVTPVIDGLAAEGVLFRNAYSQPVCSPTRAAILTGRYPRRYGLGDIIRAASSSFELPLDEIALPVMLQASPWFAYENSMVGKWHLSAYASPSRFDGPLLHGIDWWAGNLSNLRISETNDGLGKGYFHWERYADGIVEFEFSYATTKTVDDALDRIDLMPEPWLLYLPFNAGHVPFHVPPLDLTTYNVTAGSNGVTKYRSAVEAMDTELGRLLDSMDPAVLENTTVIFVGDNGTPSSVVQSPWDSHHAKETVYEGGVNVPLIITGPLVQQPGSESAALVHVVDIFSTAAEIAGVDLQTLDGGDTAADARVYDGFSLVPYLADPLAVAERQYVYTDIFNGNGSPPYSTDDRMIRDERWKLKRTLASEEFFDLQGIYTDGPNLLLGLLTVDQEAAYLRLSAELDQLEADLVYGS